VGVFSSRSGEIPDMAKNVGGEKMENVNFENVRVGFELAGMLDVGERALKNSVAVLKQMSTNELLEELREEKKRIQKELAEKKEHLPFFVKNATQEATNELIDKIEQLEADLHEVTEAIKQVQKKLRKERKPVFQAISITNKQLKNIKLNRETVFNQPDISTYINNLACQSFHETLVPNLTEHLRKIELERIRQQKRELEQKMKELKNKE